jgi:hypothetical protein
MIATQLRPSPDNAQRDRLVGVAAKAFDFEVVIPGIQGVTERRGWLSRSMKAGIRLFPRLACQAVGGLAGLRRLFCGCSDRCPVNAFPWSRKRSDARIHATTFPRLEGNPLS